ncbi:MAG: hypothetical protein WC936_02320 [Candidatus Nanoarchaeia archaeon]|jgi:hypothetical protein
MGEELEKILLDNNEIINFKKMFANLKEKRPEYAEVLGTLFESSSYLNPQNVSNYSSYLVIGGYAVLLNLIKKAQELYKNTGLEKYSAENIILKWRGSHDVDLVGDETSEKKLPSHIFNQFESSNHNLVKTKKCSFNYVGPTKNKESEGIHGDIYIIPFGKKVKIANAEFERDYETGFKHETVNLYGINIFIPKVSDLIKSKITDFKDEKTIEQIYEKIKNKRQRDLVDIINIINSSDSKLNFNEFNEKERQLVEFIYKTGKKFSEEMFFKDIYLNNKMKISWQK